MKHLKIPLDIFRRGVLIFIGTTTELRKQLKKDGFTQEEISEAVDCFDTEEYDAQHARAITTLIGLDALIFAREPMELRTLVHEITHAVTRIMDIIGTSDDETRAYLSEYLYEQSEQWVTSLLCESRE